MEDNQEQIKMKISTLIKNQDRPFKEMSQELGMSYTTFLSYANGISIPRPDTMKKLADYFETTVSFIMGVDEERKELNLEEIRIILNNYLKQQEDNVKYKRRHLFLAPIIILEIVEKLSENGKELEVDFFYEFIVEFASFFLACFDSEEKEKNGDRNYGGLNTAELHLAKLTSLAHTYYLQNKLKDS
jgi:transcriptional regulator with XRE-family HTH domain